MKSLVATVLAAAVLATPAVADEVLFDFENAQQYSPLPIDLSVGGLGAHFDYTGEGYSIQDAGVLFPPPTGFSGLCIYPSSVFLADLLISYDHTLTDFSILYAAQELDCDSSSTMRVTAYMDGAFVGTATKSAIPGGNWPSATLAISVPGGFNSVVVHYDKVPPFGCDYGVIFMADNMRITPKAQPPCYPDFTGDGVLDLFDFLSYVNAFNAADPSADCTGDGAFDLFDFLCFVNQFNQGC
jgi:hypothetical protein